MQPPGAACRRHDRSHRGTQRIARSQPANLRGLRPLRGRRANTNRRERPSGNRHRGMEVHGLPAMIGRLSTLQRSLGAERNFTHLQVPRALQTICHVTFGEPQGFSIERSRRAATQPSTPRPEPPLVSLWLSGGKVSVTRRSVVLCCEWQLPVLVNWRSVPAFTAIYLKRKFGFTQICLRHLYHGSSEMRQIQAIVHVALPNFDFLSQKFFWLSDGMQIIGDIFCRMPAL